MRFFVKALLLFGVLLPCTLQAQIVTASLQGNAQDTSGATIPGAKVTAVNTATGVATNTQTDSAGHFIFPSLEPGGPYTVTVKSPTFKTEERAGIHLFVNQQANITIVLQVGATADKVEVVADATQLDTSTDSIGQVIANRSIENLPLNQRNVYQLIFLVPGITGTVTAQYNSQNFSVDGGRPGTTNILVDGIPASPPLIVPIGGFAVFPSVDAVQEFKVESTGYSAEFGRSGSGIINVILKSGTNQLHGSIYEFLRNSALDANTFFADRSGTPLPVFHRSQFGASLNGPVYIPKLYNGRDKTFFLFSYEGLRQGTQSEMTATVPTALQHMGNFSQTYYGAGPNQVTIYDPATTTSTAPYMRQAFQGNMIPSGRIDPVAAAIMAYYPLPNQPGTNTGANNFYGAGVTTLNINTIDTRVDEVINSRNRMFIRYSRRGLAQPPVLYFPKADQIAEGGYSQPQISNSAAIDYTFTPSPNFVMDFPFGFSRTALNFVPISAGFNPSTQLGFPSYIAADADHLLFPGIAPANYYTLGDASQGWTRHGGFEIFSVGVNNTKVQGKQLIKFGGDFRYLVANDVESGNSTGNYSFSAAFTQGPNGNTASQAAGNSLASFLLGLGSSGTYTIDSKNAATESKYYGLYVQDDWRAFPKLTLNLGLRYDLDIPRTERHNRMETFDPTAPSPLAATTGLIGLSGGTVFVGVNGQSRRQFSPRWNDFGPRVGFAYQLSTNTAIRGAYGVYFAPSVRSAGATVGNEGFSASTTYAGSANGVSGPFTYLSNPFPTGLNQPVGSSLGLDTGIGSTFENPLMGDNKVGYTQNFNLDIQRQLPSDILIDIAYVGSRGVHLNKSGESDWNANQLTPATLALGTQLQGAVKNPFYGIITTGPEDGATIPLSYLDAPFPQFTGIDLSYLNGGYEEYSSVQVKVVKQLSHGLNVLVSYTGGKQFDDYSGIENVGNITGGIQNIYNPLGEYSVSSNDISQNLVVSGVYSLPFGRGQTFGSNWNRPVDLLLGGWQINGITTQQTGFPLSPTTTNSTDSGSNTLRPNVVPGVSPVIKGPIIDRLTGYLNSAAFTQPSAFQFGNATRTLSNVRAPGMHDLDFSVFKNFHATDRVNVEFRAESFNILNQVVFGSPNMTLSSGQFGVISSQANTPRQIQLALKILF